MKHGTFKIHSKEWATFQKINTDITQTECGGGVGGQQGADMRVRLAGGLMPCNEIF